MRFYTNQHPFYCGIDLHARSMYVCILSHDGEILAPFKFQLTLSAQPLAGLGWRLKAESS
jgi:hypothetical protein